MNNTINENNAVEMSGIVAGVLELSHEIYDEKYYIFKLSCKRDSGAVDVIPVQLSNRLFDIDKITVGSTVKVEGQIRSYNKRLENSDKTKLILSVFATSISIEDDENYCNDYNKVYLNGFICKQPTYRETPLGREISDVLIAVNRQYGKSDYIPCIAWGRGARFASSLKVGTAITIVGRFQSRQYTKLLEDGTTEVRSAYEVSTMSIREVSQEKESEE